MSVTTYCRQTMLLVSHRTNAKHVHAASASKGEATRMRKGTRHGCNQCQMHMQCLMYMVRPAHEASPFLTLSTCIHLTPCRITVNADDVHSRHARQTQQVQLPAHQSPLMFSLNPKPITFPTKSDNTCSVQVRGAKHCPEPAQVLHTVCN